jgi:hypothetical protein
MNANRRAQRCRRAARLSAGPFRCLQPAEHICAEQEDHDGSSGHKHGCGKDPCHVKPGHAGHPTFGGLIAPTVNVTMTQGRVSRINYVGPTGGLLSAGEQCAFAVQNALTHPSLWAASRHARLLPRHRRAVRLTLMPPVCGRACAVNGDQSRQKYRPIALTRSSGPWDRSDQRPHDRDHPLASMQRLSSSFRFVSATAPSVPAEATVFEASN